MNLLHEMIIRNQKMAKSCNPSYAGGTDLTAAEKKKLDEMKKLDVQNSTKRPVYYKSAVVAKSGPGGVIFDFGQMTGNPVADNFTNIINQFAEPGQVAITEFQNKQLGKSLNRYVELGERAYAAEAMSKSSGPDEYAGKGTDEIIKAMAEKGELDCSEHGTGPGIHVSGKFNKSTMRLNGEEIVAQSETDAAVVDMLKGLNLPTEKQIEFMGDADVEAMLKTPN